MAAPIVTGQIALIQAIFQKNQSTFLAGSKTVQEVLQEYSTGPLPIGSQWENDPDSSTEPLIASKLAVMETTGKPYFQNNPWNAEPFRLSTYELSEARARVKERGKPIFIKRRGKSSMSEDARRNVSTGIGVRLHPDGTLEMLEVGKLDGNSVTASTDQP